MPEGYDTGLVKNSIGILFKIHCAALKLDMGNLTYMTFFLYNENVSDLDKAIQIAAQAHKQQKDRFGLPYILHPLRLLFRMNSEVEQVVAILHDVVEKSDWTQADLLREGFSPEIVEAVMHLTKREDEPYLEYVQRAANNDLTRRVKQADLEDHLDSLRRFGTSNDDMMRAARYKEALQVINK